MSSLPLHNYDKLKEKEFQIENEKNSKPPSTSLISNQIQTRKLLLLVTIIEIATFGAVIKNREKIDDVHQMLNSVLLGIISAGLSQSIIQFARPVSYNKIIKFFVWGGINGLLTSYWIDFLVIRFDYVPYRVAVDLGIGMPSFQSLFLIYNCIWENNDIRYSFATSFYRTLMASYLVWTGVSIGCFGFLPQHLIFPVNCSVTLVWNVVLGLLT